jgi:rRNA biogenesis protein RRP5
MFVRDPFDFDPIWYRFQISQVSDDHVPTLPPSTGPWKIGTIHRARVTGHIHFDGLLQLSLRPSILNQKFLQVSDVAAGEIVKATVKKLTDTAMFVTMSGSVDGVVWPNHYADIALKHPAKRFRVGSSIKCRVLVVDPERNRIALTAKKTLIESTLPIVSSMDEIEVGMVTHAVVFKVLPKSLQVEFYNNMKAIVPLKEVR